MNGELARHLPRLFRSLDSWLGQDDGSARSWLTTPNLDLGERPIDLLSTVRGPLRTSDYVDASALASEVRPYRGRVIRIDAELRIVIGSIDAAKRRQHLPH